MRLAIIEITDKTLSRIMADCTIINNGREGFVMIYKNILMSELFYHTSNGSIALIPYLDSRLSKEIRHIMNLKLIDWCYFDQDCHSIYGLIRPEEIVACKNLQAIHN